MERQLETAKVEVTKPFAQEVEIVEKLEVFKVKAVGSEKQENHKEKEKR